MSDKFEPSRRRWMMQVAGIAVAAAAMRVPSAWAFAVDAAPGKRAPLKWTPALQLYTLGLKDSDDLGAAFEELAAIGYREVEFAGNYGKTASELRKLLDAAQLTAPATHVAPQVSGGTWNLDEVEILAGELKVLGASYAILGGPYYPGISHDKPFQVDDWKRVADFLNEKGQALRKHGIRLAYHNHAVEFQPQPGGVDGYRTLVENSDPNALEFELDIGWAVAARQDVSALFKLLGERLKLLHLKDTLQHDDKIGEVVSADTGAGAVKWEELVELMRHSSVKHAFVEQEPPFPTTPMDALKHNYRFLEQLFAGRTA